MLASPADAQWYVSGGWGASDDLDVETPRSVQSLQIGLQGLTDAGRLFVAAGLPVRSGEDLTWGLIEAATSPSFGREDDRGIGFQPDLLARGFLYHDPLAEASGAGGLLAVEPYATWGTDAVLARVGGGARAVGTTVDSVSSGTIAGIAAGDLVVVPAAGVSVRARAELLLFDARSLPHAELGLFYDVTFGALWAGIDRWEGDALRATGWYAGGALDLTEALSARITVGRASGDPLFGTPPRDTWSVSVRYRIAPRPAAAPAPARPAYEAFDDVYLSVPASAAPGDLFVAGSFNGWQPRPMIRRGDSWTIRLELPAGYHEFAFVDGRGRWFVPEGIPGRRPDGMGGWVVAVVVR